jgi:tetratricopeptide (TPR) repeat protein
MTEEEKEAMREKKKWEGYVPHEKKRPPDEFFNLKTLETDCTRVEIIDPKDSSCTRITYQQAMEGTGFDPDSAIIKFVLQDGKGTLVQNTDDAYYRHETRHDNGQLVDFSERRKVDEKFEMKNPCFHEHYKVVLRSMCRGEAAYVRFPRLYHKGAYHNAQHYLNKTPEEKATIGDYIFVRFDLRKIKRNPEWRDKDTFEGVMEYYEKIREVSKELMEEGEYNFASELYKRILPNFKNMPRTMRDALNEEEKQKRIDAHHILLLNIALCNLKKDLPRDAVKCCKEAIDVKQDNPKAYYRLAVSQKLNGELEPAKESILTALKLAPNDPAIRAEYSALMDLMNAKHKQWFKKMNGFLHSDKMKEIEKSDQDEQVLKAKILKKEFGGREN